jgi:2-phosphoglycerate kinase
LGTGFVRAILQSETTPERDPLLYSMTFQADDPVAHLHWQATRLRSAVLTCIERARAEGTSLVVEGSHLLPSFYHDAPVDGFVVLEAPEPEEHLRRLTGETHTRRMVTDVDLERVRRIDAHYVSDATAVNVPVVRYDGSVDEIRRALGSER